MNLFVLHPDPFLCAQMHGDKHVVKMPLETAQVLCTAQRLHSTVPDTELDRLGVYALSYAHHPITKWIGESAGNYAWVFALFTELCKEFRYRRQKTHKCELLVEPLRNIPSRIARTGYLRTARPLCMPDTFKTSDAVLSYRMYYLFKTCQGKVDYKWGRSSPEWLRTLYNALLRERQRDQSQ